MKIDVNKPVLYVEPNYVGSERSDGLEVGNFGVIPCIMPMEDYCIYVDLRVEVYGRGMGTATNPNRKTYIMQWRSNEDKNEVSFLSGTEIHLEGNSGASVNYLTTNYTNTYLGEINEGRQTNELFGISSIDIKYNQYFVPEVTIQFIDVRGGSLFAVSQKAHQAEKDGIGGYRDSDIADSFFNCFFMTPYPQFEIIIKGFYGEPVSYRLNCTGFKTSFDSQSGNFNATASFMGYAFSFLGDISFNALMAAPYADCGGKEYWKARSEQIEDDFFLFGQNGDKVKIPTLADILVSLDNVEEKMKSQTDSSAAYQKQSELENKKAELNELLTKNEAYMASWNNLFPTEKGYIHIGGGAKDLIILAKEPGGEGIRYRVQETDESKAVEEAHKAVVECAKSLGLPPRYSEDFQVTGTTTGKLLIYDSVKKEYRQSGLVKEYSHGDTNHDLTADVDNVIKNNKEIKDGNYVDGYYIRNYYLEFSEDIEAKNREIDSEINANMTAVEAANAEALTNILGFTPTIYNVCKVFFAHLETYVWLYYNTCGKIYSDLDSRKALNLGMDNPQVVSDFKARDGRNSIVPPFPQVSSVQQQKDGVITENTSMDGTQVTSQTTINNADGTRTVIEEDWLENISPNFEEINMINGLLNGARIIGEYIARHQESEANAGQNGSEGSDRKCAVSCPVTPGDTVLLSSNESGPWGTIDQSDYSSFCGKVFIRMMQVLGYGGYDEFASIAGKLDAKNFVGKTELNSVVGDKISGEHPFDEFLNVVTAKDANYAKEGHFAWEASSSSHYGIARLNGSDYGLCTRLENGDTVLPFESLTYAEINSALKPTNDNPPVFSLPNNFSKYAMFSDTSISKVEKAQNRNVFCIDRMYASYGGYFAYKNSLTEEEKAYVEKMSLGSEFSMEQYLTEYYNMEKVGKFIPSVSTSNVQDFIGNAVFTRMPCAKESDLSPSEDGCVFCSKTYNKQSGNASRAYVLLNSLLVFASKNKNEILANLTQKLSTNSQRFNIIPKFHALLLGAEIYMAKEGKASFDGSLKLWDGILKTGLRKEVIDGFVAFFQNWATSDFLTIDKTYGVALKPEFYSNTKDVSNDKISTIAVSEEDFKLKYNTEDEIDFDGGTASLEADFGKNVDFKELAEILINPVMLVSCSSENKSGRSAKSSISQSSMKAYWDAFTEELKSAKPDEAASDTGAATGNTATQAQAPEDLKVALYHHCKVFFDKWLAGSSLDDFDERWKLGSYFDKNDTRNGKFHFIDSFYNDVSNRVLVNPQIVIEDIMQSQSLDGYTLMSVLSDVLSKNRFMLFCIENFKNLFDEDMFMKSFRPVPYNQITVKRQNSDIVAMYSYEPSSHLEEVDYNYPGDSFMLDHEQMYPYAISEKDVNYDYPLPAFGVTYGMQYQSFFTNIDVSMEKPMVTETSLKTQYLLAGASNDTTLTRQYVPYGQDLFSIYSNNAYTCEVTMMGCAWVQPLMYFCLTNVPMFRGSYLISKVTHRITPGQMETHFTGTRMANKATRLTTNWIKKGYMPDEFYQSRSFNRYDGGTGTVGSNQGGGDDCRPNGPVRQTGKFPAGREPIPDGFYKDDVLFYFITHAEGKVAVQWVSSKSSHTTLTNCAINGYDLPGGLHSKRGDDRVDSLGFNDLNVTMTNRGRNAVQGERKCGAGWGWYSTEIQDDDPYWQKLMPAYRDAMIWAWNQPEIQQITDPATRLAKMHTCNWKWARNIKSGMSDMRDWDGRIKAAKDACSGMGNLPTRTATGKNCLRGTASQDGGEIRGTLAVYGSIRQKIVQLCLHYEKMGPRSGSEQVAKWNRNAGLSPNENWCSSFAYNMLLEAGETELTSKMKAAGAGNPDNFARLMIKTSSPIPGDLVVAVRKKHGHVGVIIEVNGNNITTMDGNYSKTVKRAHGTFNGASATFKGDDRQFYLYTYNYQ